MAIHATVTMRPLGLTDAVRLAWQLRMAGVGPEGAALDTEVLDLIERIYAAGASRGHWNDLLEAIPDLAGCEAANMLVGRPKAGTMTVLSPRTDEAFIDAFFTDWWRHDPTYGRTLTAPVGEVVTLADTGRDRFLESGFYQEFWKTSGHGAERIRANLIMNRDIQIGFGLMPAAQADEITAHMRKVHAALLPHLIRAVEIEWHVSQLELENAAALTGRGAAVLVVNSAGRILLADATAETILGRGTPLTMRHGVLRARETRDNDTLHRLIRSCQAGIGGHALRGGTAEIGFGDGTSLTCRVMPLPADRGGFGLDIDDNARPAAVVVLEDAAARRAGDATRLQAHFLLTPKEAIVALECLKGGTRAQLAARLGLSDSTIRTHLTRIFEKTRTRRKAELVALLYRNGYSG